MVKKFRFLSSLPRSGSTLLANILAQNPSIHATHTSACLDVIFALRNNWDTLAEHKAHPMPVAKLNVMRAILPAYYQDVDKPIVLDKSRGWLPYLEMVESILDEKAKVLVTIRNIPDILASLEKLNRNTAKIQQPPGEAANYFQFQTQKGRCDYWLGQGNLLGLAYNRIIDAVQRGFRDRLHFIDFEDLTTKPKETLKGIYDFLQEPQFKHDFQNIEQVTTEDDAVHGFVDLHKIRGKVETLPHDAVEVIGEQLVKQYSALNLKFS